MPQQDLKTNFRVKITISLLQLFECVFDINEVSRNAKTVMKETISEFLRNLVKGIVSAKSDSSPNTQLLSELMNANLKVIPSLLLLQDDSQTRAFLSNRNDLVRNSRILSANNQDALFLFLIRNKVMPTQLVVQFVTTALENLASVSTTIWETRELNKDQLTIICLLVAALLQSEHVRSDGTLIKRVDNFVMLVFNKLLNAYREMPESIFSLLLAFLQTIFVEFQKDTLGDEIARKQTYFRMGIKIFRMWSSLLQAEKDWTQSEFKGMKTDLNMLCKVVIYHTFRLFGFDNFYLSTSEYFLSSEPEKFTQGLIKQLFEEYNLLMNLRFAAEDARPTTHKADLDKSRTVFWIPSEGHNEFLELLFFLHELVRKLSSANFNAYLREKFKENLRLSYFAKFLVENKIENADLYIEVI